MAVTLTEKQIERFSEYFPEIQYYEITTGEWKDMREELEWVGSLMKNGKSKNGIEPTRGWRFSWGVFYGILITSIGLLMANFGLIESESINETSDLYSLKLATARYWYPVNDSTSEELRAKNLYKFARMRHNEAEFMTLTEFKKRDDVLKSTLLKAGDNYRAALELNPQLRNEEIEKSLGIIRVWAISNDKPEIIKLTEGLDEMYRNL